MEMVKAVGLKRYYDTEENEVRAPVSYTHLDVYKRQACR